STSQLRLSAVSTAARITAFNPGASPPPVEIARRIASFGEQFENLSGFRVAIQLRFLENRGPVANDLETTLARRYELDVGVGILLADLGRQTDGSGLVVSNR